MVRWARLLSTLASFALLAACNRSDHAGRVTDLDGHVVDPFAAKAAATVLVFVSTSCPISNRYAPEIRRLYQRFSPRGVEFRLVYPSPIESPPAIREHLHEYGYDLGALRDPGHVLVERAGVTVTPEAVVFVRHGKMVYRGRIDDREADLGASRSEPTRHDLELALEAVLDGRTVDTPQTTAVGCSIPPLR